MENDECSSCRIYVICLLCMFPLQFRYIQKIKINCFSNEFEFDFGACVHLYLLPQRVFVHFFFFNSSKRLDNSSKSMSSSLLSLAGPDELGMSGKSAGTLGKLEKSSSTFDVDAPGGRTLGFGCGFAGYKPCKQTTQKQKDIVSECWCWDQWHFSTYLHWLNWWRLRYLQTMSNGSRSTNEATSVHEMCIRRMFENVISFELFCMI